MFTGLKQILRKGKKVIGATKKNRGIKTIMNKLRHDKELDEEEISILINFVDDFTTCQLEDRSEEEKNNMDSEMPENEAKTKGKNIFDTVAEVNQHHQRKSFMRLAVYHIALSQHHMLSE